MPANPGVRPRRFLVIGCGSIGKRHIRNVLELRAGEIDAFDVRPDRRDETRSQFAVETVDSLEAGWARSPDVALITVPTSLHVPLAFEGAQRGCHLFVEKPLSDRLDGVDQLLDAVRKRRLVTLVGCNMRFHPGLRKVKSLLEENAVGRVVAARVEAGHYLPDWHPWEDYRQSYSARKDLGGGVVLDAIHEIDYIRWMMGEVDSVACFASKLSALEIDTEDTAAVLLKFVSGAIGEVHLDYVQRVYSRTCHIIGDQGTIRWDYTAGEVRWYSAATREWQSFPNPPGWDANDMYLDEMRHFLQCVDRSEETVSNVFEGKRVLKLALAARASAVNGTVVRLQ